MIAIVPIRSGSKEIKNKNIKTFHGKPLVWWILNSLQNSSVKKIIVALDQSYKEIIESFNFDKVKTYIRDPKNSADFSQSEDVLIEVINFFEINDDILFAQATSPLTSTYDIEKGIKIYSSKEFESILSVVKVERFVWDNKGKPLNYNYLSRPRRQDFNDCFFENGAFYINHSKNIIRTKNRISGKIGYCQMPFETFFEIDSKTDWELVSFLKNIV